MGPPPADCVVMTERMPQALPLQPFPESDQERTALGLEPGTGVSVATIAAVTPGWRLEGAASWSAKWLAMVTMVELCFEGSAMLAAVMVTPRADGRMAGAVENSVAAMVPQFFRHGAPESVPWSPR